MRICLLTSDFLPNIGGVAAHIYELARALTMLDHRIVVIHTVERVPVPPDGDLAGFPVYRIPFHTVGTPLHPLLPVRLLRLRQLAARVEGLLRRHGIQVLHWHTIRPVGLVARMVRQPGVLKVFTNHTSGYLEMIGSPVGRLKARLHLGHAQGVIAPSRELAEASRLLGLPPSRVFLIPNGVDVERFRPRPPDRALQSRLGIEPDELVVLCPRRLVPKNGVRYLAEAVPAVVETFGQVRFAIVGDGDAEEKSHVMRILAEAGVTSHVLLTGAVPNVSMPALYNLSDIVVLPSLVEATSIAGLEAMASGCPLVGTTVGGIPALIQDGETGYLVPPRDPHTLAEAILTLLRSEEQRRRMGRAARRLAQDNFNWRLIARRTVETYVALGAM